MICGKFESFDLDHRAVFYNRQNLRATSGPTSRSVDHWSDQHWADNRIYLIRFIFPLRERMFFIAWLLLWCAESFFAVLLDWWTGRKPLRRRECGCEIARNIFAMILQFILLLFC